MTDPLILLQELIHERTGLDLNRGLDDGFFLERMTVPFRESGSDSFSDYYRRLRDADTTSEEWTAVFAAFSRPASSFFRHRWLTGVLTDTLMPCLMTRECVRIWSA